MSLLLSVLSFIGAILLLLILWYIIARLSTAAYFRSKRDYMMEYFKEKKEKHNG